MAVVEQPCYTLINFPSDLEPPNEMQLKSDLGLCELSVILTMLSLVIMFYISSIKIPVIDRVPVLDTISTKHAV